MNFNFSGFLSADIEGGVGGFSRATTMIVRHAKVTIMFYNKMYCPTCFFPVSLSFSSISLRKKVGKMNPIIEPNGIEMPPKAVDRALC